jgi:NAD(P)H dehydrogenase (quinone)
MDVNVLVIFYSRYGVTEKLALAAGVGAIQARANIRLRRLADLAGPETIQSDSPWSENLERMKKDYIAPREVDVQWADVLILAAPRDCTAEMERYLNSARELLKGKIAAVLGREVADAAARAGLSLVPADEDPQDSKRALAYGKLAAETGRSKKEASAP